MQSSSKRMLLVALGITFMLSMGAVSSGQDSDGDGVIDPCDQCPGTPSGFAVDAVGCRLRPVFRLQSTTPVYYLVVDGQLSNPNSSDFQFDSYVRTSGPGSEDAIRILYSFLGSSEVAWARPYSDGTVQMWDKGDYLTYGSSSGKQHDVEGGPTNPSPITTSAACAPYNGITITVTMLGDEDGDGVPDAQDLCPGTAPGAVVDEDGCPEMNWPVGWGDFSGREKWIDFGDFYDMPNPVFYEGCWFTEQGTGVGSSGWQFDDHSYFFLAGAETYPGLSLGGSLINRNGRTEIRVDFTDYSGIQRVGVLGTTSMPSTYALEAYDVGDNLIYSVQETMPAFDTPVWLGLQTLDEISYILITEPLGDNGFYAIFDDLRFEPAVDLTDSDGDGVVDYYDACPDSDANFPVEYNGCQDTDADGVADMNDICPGSNPAYPVDKNGCLDTDGDGVADVNDLCADSPPGVWIDPNGCEMPDTDNDGVYDPCDSCPGTAPGAWVDPLGCEMPDTDNDGVYDPCDDCPGTAPETQVTTRGCPDADGDNVADTEDICPNTPVGMPVDAYGCPDMDQDGVVDPCDDCPDTPPNIEVDERGCAVVFAPILAVTAAGWGDYNNDGYSDMLGAQDVYTNNGDGTFTVTTPFAAPYGGQPSIGDYNNDGLLDHYSLGTYAGGHLYLNNGDETWTARFDLTHWSFYDTPRNSNGQTCVDLNGDGYLDTYMTGWWDYDPCTSSDVIFTSTGDGVSDPCWRMTWVEPSYRHCKGATPCDFDEDGDQDVYVSGYWMVYSHLWRNDSFDGYTGLTDVALTYGVNDGPGHTQGSCWADFDNDGHFDLFVANFAHAGNPQARFMQNQGSPDYHFTDKGLCGVTQVEPLSCGIAGDYDNDGDVDILVTVSGGYSWKYIMLYSNNGDWTFTETTVDMGLDEQGPQDIGAWGDYDNDGYLDLIAAGQLWANPGGDNHWLKVKLLGGPHTDGLVNGAAIGAQVRINVPGLGVLTRQVEGNTGQVGCQNDLTMHFGLGSHTDAVDLVIDWPNGYQQIVSGVAVDQAITIQLQPPVTIPACWNYLTQCHGDTDGDGDVDTVDWPIFRDSFGYAYPAAQYRPCGDMDHDGDVDTVDWPEFRDNFGYAAPADCTPGGTWPPSP